MDSATAILLFSALAQETRLAVFQALARDGETTAGDLALSLGIPPSTLSFHLKDLRVAGLIQSRRQGRRLLYRIRPETLEALRAFFAPF